MVFDAEQMTAYTRQALDGLYEAVQSERDRATTAEQQRDAARAALQVVADWLTHCWEPDDRYYGFAGVRDHVRAALAQTGAE